MVEFLLAFPVAAALGFLAGMGVGGGSLLLLWLTQIAHVDHPQARLINLLFYIPAAVIATLFRRKQQQLHIKTAFPGMASGCIAAFLLTFMSQHMDITLLKKLLGSLLIAIGLREIFYRERKAR